MSSSDQQPAVIVLTAPSGSGKTSIAQRLLDAFPAMHFSVSATTRPPRDGETDGVSYHFLTEARFRQLIEADELIEHEEVYPGLLYGTLRSEITRSSVAQPVLLDIDVRGAVRVKEVLGARTLTVFVRPPSMDVLEQRLRARRTESEESLRTRLKRARKELTFESRFDAVVVNDRLDEAARETIARVRSFLKLLRSKRQSEHE